MKNAILDSMKEMQISEEAELTQVVDAVLEVVTERKDGGTATVLALHGDLGAGKTTFTQALAKKLDVSEIVTSPTFVIMKLYELVGQTFEKLVHIDAYRIEADNEMRVLGFDELLKETRTLMCIEWAENVATLLPEDTIHLTFAVEDQGRKITIT